MNSNNPDENCSYEVQTGKDLMEKYGLTAESRPEIKLNPDNVPPKFRYLIPLAEEWGISDDLIRADVIAKADTEALQQMLAISRSIDTDALFEWLAGPEAYLDFSTDEYIAFSCLILAADEVSFQLEKREKETSEERDKQSTLKHDQTSLSQQKTEKKSADSQKRADWRDFYL